jgi:hypothetical protein
MDAHMAYILSREKKEFGKNWYTVGYYLIKAIRTLAKS